MARLQLKITNRLTELSALRKHPLCVLRELFARFRIGPRHTIHLIHSSIQLPDTFLLPCA